VVAVLRRESAFQDECALDQRGIGNSRPWVPRLQARSRRVLSRDSPSRQNLMAGIKRHVHS
jgi:hypothetical protein